MCMQNIGIWLLLIWIITKGMQKERDENHTYMWQLVTEGPPSTVGAPRLRGSACCPATLDYAQQNYQSIRDEVK